jgi:hypothetical protein
MFIFSAPKKSYILWTKGPDLSKNLNQSGGRSFQEVPWCCLSIQ